MSRSVYLSVEASGFSAGVELAQEKHLVVESTTPQTTSLTLVHGVEPVWTVDLDTISVRKLRGIFNALELHLDSN